MGEKLKNLHFSLLEVVQDEEEDAVEESLQAARSQKFSVLSFLKQVAVNVLYRERSVLKVLYILSFL
jgi:hypothetical protein